MQRAMVNQLLLADARRRGAAVYRTTLRRTGMGLHGGGVLTKGELREVLAQDHKRRLLVNQISTLGRDVRSTPMQWSYEGKKLDATVKFMSWLPPWVVPGADKEEAPGRRFLRESCGDFEDQFGLGRHLSTWYTLNCKYNAAFDVQRLNVGARGREAEVLGEPGGKSKEERFVFARDNPDLVMFELSLRTELIMRMVMPSVLRHSKEDPFMAMARFETGKNGNPHWHGFGLGLPPPRMGRVRAGAGGEGDEVPDAATVDAVALERDFVLGLGSSDTDSSTIISRCHTNSFTG